MVAKKLLRNFRKIDKDLFRIDLLILPSYTRENSSVGQRYEIHAKVADNLSVHDRAFRYFLIFSS